MIAFVEMFDPALLDEAIDFQKKQLRKISKQAKLKVV
jgi:hypothetical protein